MQLNSDQIAKARALVADTLLNEILDNLEKNSINEAVYAEKTNDELRAASMAEVRAIRALRAKLKSIAAHKEADE